MAEAKNTVLFPYETLHKLCMDAFQKFGFSEKEADIIQDVLLTSDLFGIQSHGMQRMVRYHKGITNGLIKIDAKPEIVKETPISAVIDGHDGMGQLLGHKAMEMAIEKAKKSGVGIVSVRNSNHYGIAAVQREGQDPTVTLECLTPDFAAPEAFMLASPGPEGDV
ncbi:MAG: Ldh family oxidoreductase, partial [Veillonella sp.]